MKRRQPLLTNTIHHIYSKSISHYQIFNSNDEYKRFFNLISYYRFNNVTLPFSQIARNEKMKDRSLSIEETINELTRDKQLRVEIIAYCIMPTHFHLILNQLLDSGIERLIAAICNGYTHYFNLRHNRKGPLWQSRFGNSQIFCDQELIETVRYVHLNPTTAYLCDNPSSWTYNSFNEYIGKGNLTEICKKEKVLAGRSLIAYQRSIISEIQNQRLIE